MKKYLNSIRCFPHQSLIQYVKEHNIKQEDIQAITIEYDQDLNKSFHWLYYWSEKLSD